MEQTFIASINDGGKSYAQAGQDVFAWDVAGNPRKGSYSGTFVDIGCNDPLVHSNTAMLEELGWTGVAVDIEKFDYSCRPKTIFIQADARDIIPRLDRFIHEHKKEIDYLSMDADDASFDCLERLVPFFKFKAITIEHDSYRVGPECKKKIYEFLTSFGYERAREDVLAPEAPGMPWSNQPFEDWYILK